MSRVNHPLNVEQKIEIQTCINTFYVCDNIIFQVWGKFIQYYSTQEKKKRKKVPKWWNGLKFLFIISLYIIKTKMYKIIDHTEGKKQKTK